MKPNLHPEQAKALYREIANDAGPARSGAPGIGLGPAEDGVPVSDGTLWLAIVGGLAIVVGVVVIAGVRALV